MFLVAGVLQLDPQLSSVGQAALTHGAVAGRWIGHGNSFQLVGSSPSLWMFLVGIQAKNRL